jgi:hypothetical protein
VRAAGSLAGVLLLLVGCGARAADPAPRDLEQRCGGHTDPSGTSVELCLAVSGDLARDGGLPVRATLDTSGTPAPQPDGIVYSLDGTYLLTDEQAPWSFSLHPAAHRPGTHVLSASVTVEGRPGALQVDVPIDVPAVTRPAVAPFRPTAGADPAPGAPFVVAAVGDGASGLRAEQQVTDLIASWRPQLLLYLGDVYEHGSAEEFANWYGDDGRLYGRFRAITNPTVGNHEFELDSTGAPYFRFWGDPPPWYSYDTHGWHVVTLDDVGPSTSLAPDSPQYRWLADDLARHPDRCTLVTVHRPRFTVGRDETHDAGVSEAAVDFDAFWRLLADHHVPLLVSGHSHNYQRWQPLDAGGRVTAAGGTTQFVVGTGGQWTSPLAVPDPRLAAGVGPPQTTWGALQLRLTPTGADYRFVTVDGVTKDAGRVPCAP